MDPVFKFMFVPCPNQHDIAYLQYFPRRYVKHRRRFCPVRHHFAQTWVLRSTHREIIAVHKLPRRFKHLVSEKLVTCNGQRSPRPNFGTVRAYFPQIKYKSIRLPHLHTGPFPSDSLHKKLNAYCAPGASASIYYRSQTTGWCTSYTTIMQKYKISKTTVYDIKKSELKLTKFVDSTEKDVKKFSQVKNPLYENVDKAVNIWYESQRLSGVPIRGIELQTAASHFASKLNNPTFKASGGWLSRYRARHNLKNKKVVGEALSADEDAANRFKDDSHKLMTDEKYEQFQIYNADETGVYWKSLPDNSQVKNANSASGHKQSKDRLSVLLCANADASHKNVLAVVGKSKRPRAIKNIIDRLPVHYYSSHKAWFNQSIYSERFFKRFINDVRNFQENKLRVAPDQVKALLLVDNSPAHPTELISNDGNIKCKLLPPNTTSVLQPMDQGVIVAFKRLYKRRQLESCLVFSSDADQPNNSVGEQTFSNLKKYDIKKAIFNFGNSWDELKSSTIRNGWKILLEHKNNSDLETAGDALQLSEDESYEDEQEIRRLEQLFQRARIELNQESINEWIDIDLDDPGHNVLSNDDIVEAVLSEKWKSAVLMIVPQLLKTVWSRMFPDAKR
ncbi:hypothetical protein LAZ67_4003879 [Cordylochernes scorpioides]|uniref:HTH CENPB-type domain-containing protein n=1 Tax=Cordylochernes scorpioides TaxID=51811 RepID=A0ABY6KE97_9ARAC|nr:hypothetical protein LAZ67_4003879 [Cordylochernes scorpioides]